MRFKIKFFSVLMVSVFAISSAFAESESANYLPDIVSPDEMAKELGIGPNEVVPLAPNAVGRLQIRIDKTLQGKSPTAQTMQIYLDGELVYNLLISTGRERNEVPTSGKKYFSSTPTGTFRITHRYKDYYSQTWQAPMPYAQFFNGGIAVHATTKDHYKDLGKRASGGCVRMTLDSATMLWDLVDEIGVSQAVITVYGR